MYKNNAREYSRLELLAFFEKLITSLDKTEMYWVDCITQNKEQENLENLQLARDIDRDSLKIVGDDPIKELKKLAKSYATDTENRQTARTFGKQKFFT